MREKLCQELRKFGSLEYYDSCHGKFYKFYWRGGTIISSSFCNDEEEIFQLSETFSYVRKEMGFTFSIPKLTFVTVCVIALLGFFVGGQ